MNTSFIGFAVLAFLAVVLSIEGVYLFWTSHHSKGVKRMDERIRALSAGGNVSSEQLSILKRRMLSDSPFVTSLLLRMPRVHALDRQLQQSGLKWSVARFIAYTLLSALTGAFAGFVLHVPAPVLGVFAAVAGLLPTMIVRRKRVRRILQLERQLPDAADLIARALRAGHSFPATLGMVGQELPDPLGGEFALVFDEINYGVSMNDALLNMVSRVPVEDLRYFVIAVLIQREAGGNLAEILGSISGIIRERLKLLGKVRVLSAEGRLSAWVLAVLPFAILGLLTVLNPGYISVFWKDPAGVQLAGVAITMMLFGILWMRKIVRIHI
ncbi:Flp pilus assembly protein TadB [Burkholderia sp. Ch1-1]|uniref:Flp pilus assembly protein TadB n=1 Tax=Paraburkholderia dioscoreae TaxID=2604047 RepID=A0A5Q4ZDP4_9BURK|nr:MULTISPECIES: type II secretion system F family protein [Paraburkholderia]EIF34595.1 Flp pilus assembly protein TadB [Burkholderia sp. Ch1-1]MDR8395459.1 type II secretion system F family protein [Paraburkholderia sp. USG1]VVD33541.1 Flp pilus assembly protein TadB [Paraburkholderia dioscoreae]